MNNDSRIGRLPLMDIEEIENKFQLLTFIDGYKMLLYKSDTLTKEWYNKNLKL